MARVIPFLFVLTIRIQAVVLYACGKWIAMCTYSPLSGDPACVQMSQKESRAIGDWGNLRARMTRKFVSKLCGMRFSYTLDGEIKLNRIHAVSLVFGQMCLCICFGTEPHFTKAFHFKSNSLYNGVSRRRLFIRLSEMLGMGPVNS